MTRLASTKDWTHYLTRPFTLFGVSLWQNWYESKVMKEIVGGQMKLGLFVEEKSGVVRSYRSSKELQNFYNTIRKNIINNETKILRYLKQAQKYNTQAQKILNKGRGSVKSLDEALEIYLKTSIYGGVLPFYVLYCIEHYNYKSPRLQKISEKLIQSSFYNRILNELIVPIAERVLESEGKQRKQIIQFTTLQELKRKDFSFAKKRLQKSEQGHLWVYELGNKAETIRWYKDTSKVIKKLDGNLNNRFETSGTVAYKGKVRGIARIILDPLAKNIVFNQGDILITINSNPVFMPYILRAGAIVADEGGLASHATIVSREFKKPCITGTKIATQIFKNGDMIEVDADNGIVRKVK